MAKRTGVQSTSSRPRVVARPMHHLQQMPAPAWGVQTDDSRLPQWRVTKMVTARRRHSPALTRDDPTPRKTPGAKKALHRGTPWQYNWQAEAAVEGNRFHA